MRYTLHNSNGNPIGQANTLSELFNVAHAGEWCVDNTAVLPAFPCHVFESAGYAGLIAVPYRYRSEALAAAERAGNSLLH